MFKKLLAVFLLYVLFAVCGCDKKDPVYTDTSDIVNSDTTSATDTSLPFADTTSNSDITDTPTSTAEDSTTVPQPEFVFPTEGEKGVVFVSSPAELASAFACEYTGVPKICITDAFKMDMVCSIDKPVELYYKPENVQKQPQNAGMIISSAAHGKISIVSASPELLSCGLLTVDAPFCDMIWHGEGMPSDEDITLYCNVHSFNGKVIGELGGSGASGIKGVSLISSETGKAFEDCSCYIRGNRILFGYPLLAGDKDIKEAKLVFETDGKVEDKVYDLGTSNRITVSDSKGEERTYILEAYRITHKLPVMQIYTEENAPILSKTEYVEGTLYIDGTSYPMKVRGRGNASWSTFPKKAYRIKLDNGAPLFGLTKNRDWVLVSNYTDKSLIRNSVAHAMASKLDGLEFTSTHISVDLYLNGIYMGVYTFADKIEEGKGRLDFSPVEGDTPSSFGTVLGVTDIGFLCEVGWDFEGENVYNKDFFDAQKVTRIYVKEPKSEKIYEPEFVYAREYVFATERAIMNNYGWQNYIDVDSWVDWFIITELTFNTESVFYRSTYMWKREGGKLMLGPVWDFDMAFGNHWGDIPGYDGWCTTEFTYIMIEENWMNYLLQYSEFTDAITKRWNEKKDELLKTALEAIDKYSAELEGSQQQNFKKWDIMDEFVGAASVNPYYYDTFEEHVQYLRDFVNSRWKYMDERIASGEYYIEPEEESEETSDAVTTDAAEEVTAEVAEAATA